MNIYFVRHGDPDYSTDSLTALGKIQAEKLSVAIKDWKIEELCNSAFSGICTCFRCFAP